MNGQAFITMMKQDISTHPDKEKLTSVVDVMEYVVGQHPNCDIDSSKNAEDCFNAIFQEARKQPKKDAQGNQYYMSGHNESIRIVTEYLGLATSGTDPKPAIGRVNLEDFF